MVYALRHVRINAADTCSACSLALTEVGTVFSWGDNALGQLGLGLSEEDEALPQKIDALSRLNVCAVVASVSVLLPTAVVLAEQLSCQLPGEAS